MDHFKAHIRRTYPDMLHFLTYADNFAVGYFKKQGFSKEITLDRSVWAGYIKDYEGGTIMQCTMLRRVDYTATREIIAQQRDAVLAKIRQMSRSHEVYPGLPQFQDGAGDGAVVDYRDVPGLRACFLIVATHVPAPHDDDRRKWMDTRNVGGVRVTPPTSGCLIRNSE
jgi:histone acetyltransferase